MNIGNIQFGDRPLFLAPMEDVTDIGFRQLCKRFGAAMVYTEFVSAEALVRSVKSTISKLTIDDAERPVGIQIYGRDVPQMVEAAQIVEEQAHPDVIDLNFGCPVKKVAGKGAGAGMLQNIPLLLDITREVVKAVKTPVTVKTRLGWNKEQLVITTLAEQLQDCGIQALTIHGRTRSQMYTGEADWSLIGEVKANPRIHIPIIGNGDITTPEQAKQAFEPSNASMLSRVRISARTSIGASCIPVGTWLPHRSSKAFPTSDKHASRCCGQTRWRNWREYFLTAVRSISRKEEGRRRKDFINR